MSDCAVVWIRDDFRIRNNHALSFACKNHDAVTVIYIHNKEYFDGKREAQRWWISCLLYTSPSPRDVEESRMPSSA